MSRWVYWVSLIAVALVMLNPLVHLVANEDARLTDVFRLGIDLAGGTSLIYELRPAEPGGPVPSANEAKNVIANRINPEGTRGIVIRPIGEHRLEIILPGQVTRASRREAGPITAADVANAARTSDVQAERLPRFAGGTKMLFGLSRPLYIGDVRGRIRNAARRAAPVGAEALVFGRDVADAQRSEYGSFELWTTTPPGQEGDLAVWERLVASSLATQEDVERVKRLVRQAGFLEFRIVADRNRDRGKANFDRLKALKESGQPSPNPRFRWYPVADNYYRDLVKNGIPSNWVGVIDREAETIELLIDVGDGQDVTGEDLSNVGPSSQAGDPIVQFSIKPDAQKRFALLTRVENKGRNLAILLDGHVTSAPVLEDVPLTSGGIIRGYRNDVRRRDEVVDILNSGTLAASLGDPVFERTVGPELGADNIQKGVKAITIGLILVLAFMAVYYLGAGLVADLALLLNLLLVVCILFAVKQAWTLPGIAGLILTVGMSVDANVLIFERIREEKGEGGSLALALKRAYSRAFRTILDANVTTLIPAFFLLFLATEEVQGFAVVIVVGIATSMFTALILTRMVFETGLKVGLFKELKMLQLVTAPNVQWMAIARKALLVSGALVLVGGIVFYGRGREKYDIEFTGGTQVELALRVPAGQDELPIETVRDRVVGVLGPGAIVQRVDMETALEREPLDRFLISVSAAVEGSQGVAADEARIKAALKKAFQDVWPKAQGVQLAAEASEITLPVIRERLDREQAAPAAPADAAAEGDADAEAEPGYRFIPKGYRQFINKLRLQIAVSLPMAEQDVREALFQFLRSEHPDLVTTPLLVRGTEAAEGGFRRFDVWVGADFEGSHAGIANAEFWTGIAQGALGEREFAGTTSFEPTMAGETWHKAVITIVFSLLTIVFYMWLRFAKVGYGLAAVVALVHDVFIVLGAVAVTGWIAAAWPGNPFMITDMKINLPMVGAFLTLIGYSLNDTIVVFDRIRENRGKFGDLSVDVVNRSINQTLTRTIWTSLTTLAVVAVLYLLGGRASTLHGFAFVLSLGVLVGTYSSIAVASPVLVLRGYLLRVYAYVFPVLGPLAVLGLFLSEGARGAAHAYVLAVVGLAWMGLAAWGTFCYTAEKPWPLAEKSTALAKAVAGMAFLTVPALVVFAFFVQAGPPGEQWELWAGPAAVACLFAVPVIYPLYREVWGAGRKG